MNCSFITERKVEKMEAGRRMLDVMVDHEEMLF